METLRSATARTGQGLHKPFRRGYGLIEMVAVIGLIGTLLSLSAMVLNQSMQVHQKALVAFRQLEQLNQWSDRFGTDAMQAKSVEIDRGIRFARSPTESIRYELTGNRLSRILLRGEAQISQEYCESARLKSANWQLDSSGRIPMTVCELEFDDASSTPPILWFARLANLEFQRPNSDAR